MPQASPSADASDALAGQRVLITAGANGIGWAIAQAFRAEGARVSVCDIDDAALDSVRDSDPEIRAHRVDVSDPVQVDQWVDDAVEAWGGVDHLVNNAGSAGPTAVVEDVSVEEWRSCMSVSLDSHFFTARRVVPLLKAQRSGSIITISSSAGFFGFGMRTPYTSSKWAVIGFTKSLAIELGKYDVRANVIAPGSVEGDRINRVIAADAALRGADPALVAKEYVGGQSISRFVQADEVAALAVFLASPAAKMISGQAIAVDGHSETFHIG